MPVCAAVVRMLSFQNWNRTRYEYSDNPDHARGRSASKTIRRRSRYANRMRAQPSANGEFISGRDRFSVYNHAPSTRL